MPTDMHTLEQNTPALPATDTLESIRARIDARIEREIAGLIESGPEKDHPLIGRVYRWMRHYVDCGGKRMHGIVVFFQAWPAAGRTMRR
jgi:hypothetical protein